MLDVLLLLMIAAVIAATAAEGFLRSLIIAAILYVLTIMLGFMSLGFGFAHFLNDLVVGSLGGANKTPLFYQALIFLGLLFPIFVGGIVLAHITLGNFNIKALKWGDNVLGTIVGIFVALAFAALICNAWGVLVEEPWQPMQSWSNLRSTFDNSFLTPYMMNILRVYRKLLFPFAASRYPVFLIPQA